MNVISERELKGNRLGSAAAPNTIEFSHLIDRFEDSGRNNLRGYVTAFGDILAVFTALLMGWVAAVGFRYFFVADKYSVIKITQTDFGYMTIIILISISILLLYNTSQGHYSRGKLFWSQVAEECKAVAFIAAATTVALFATKEDFSRLWLVSFWAFLVLLLPVFRIMSAQYLINRRRWYRKAIIIGDGENARRAASALESDKYLGFRTVGFVRKAHAAIAGRNYEFRRVSDSHLTFQLEEEPYLVFAFDSAEEFTAHKVEIEELMNRSDSVIVVPPLSGFPMHEAEVLSVFKHDAVLLRLQNNLRKPWALLVKRLFDLTVCSLLLLFLAPVFLVITALIAYEGGKPVFSQIRVGRKGKRFACYKFRTMVPDADKKLAALIESNADARKEWEKNRKLKNDIRVTSIGKFLRSTSLDELPQLWNVIKGDMSLVGPRPIVPDEVPLYGDDFFYFSSTKPGLTGLWQISGRSDTGYLERIRLDKWYVRNWSLFQDVVILAKSIPIVISKRGAY